jgi:hypothetical protein
MYNSVMTWHSIPATGGIAPLRAAVDSQARWRQLLAWAEK